MQTPFEGRRLFQLCRSYGAQPGSTYTWLQERLARAEEDRKLAEAVLAWWAENGEVTQEISGEVCLADRETPHFVHLARQIVAADLAELT